MQIIRTVLLITLAASAAAARLNPPVVARLRGGKAAAPAPAGLPKLSPAWSGDTKDLGIGAGIGLGIGLVVGTAIKATTNFAAFLQAQLAATIFLHKLGLIEIHPGRITRFIPSPIIRLIDQNGDGKLDGKDAVRFGMKAAKGGLAAADVNKDGKIDESDLKVVFASNEHAALGTIAGFFVGVAKGAGVA